MLLSRIIQDQTNLLIKFASRVDLFLPIGTKINVKIGDMTKGAQSVNAELDK